MMAELLRLRRERDATGATAVEYALIVFAIAAVIVAVVFLLGATTHHLFSNSCAAVNSQGSTTVASGECS
jgi:pilus assembly protein Flp/PilA